MNCIVLNEFAVADLRSRGEIEIKRLIQPQPDKCGTFLKSAIDCSFKFFTSYGSILGVARTDWLEPKYKVNGIYWVKMSYRLLMAQVGSQDYYKQFFTTKKDFNLSVTVADVMPLLENNKWYWAYKIKVTEPK